MPPTTIERFVATNNAAAGRHFTYMRCSALYAFIAKQDPTGPNRLAPVAAEFLGLAMKDDPNRDVESYVKQVGAMADMYAEEGIKAKARSGNWSDAPVIAADVPFCRKLVN